MAKYGYTQQEWEGIRHRGFKMQCCDCGLIHVIDFRIVRKNIQLRVRRDVRATAAARRKFNFTKDED